MPSALAAVTVRRALARDGLVATELVTLPALAPRLAAQRLAAASQRALGSLEARLLVRSALAESNGRLSELAHHPATLAALADTFRELRPLTANELAALAAGSRRAAEVVDLYRAHRRLVSDRADDHDVLALAAEAVRDDDRALDDVGHVLLYLPRRLGRAELELLRALAARDRLAAIVGDSDIAAELEPFLGSAGDAPPPTRPSIEARIIRAPDPAEEARVAVRVALEHLRAGVPADRIAIVSRVAQPYSLLVHEELAAAGIDHSAPAPLRLAQSIAGRTLLGLLEWPANGHRRDELMRLLRSAPIRDPAGGATRPDRWDRHARNAGVVAGLDQWRRRLDEAKRARLERVTAPLTDATAPTLPLDGDQPEADGRIAELDALGSFVERLAAATDPGDRRGMALAQSLGRGLLVRHLGNEGAAASWSDADQRARGAVIDLLHELADLDGIGPEPDIDEFVRLLAHELERPAGRVGRFGHGVFVGRLVDAVGADLDLVVVVGAAEGTFPPRPRDDALLPERERRAAGGAMRPRGTTAEEEARDARAVLAAATTAVITFPASDPRSQRTQQPSAFVLQLNGEQQHVESFEWWLASGRPAATATEFDLGELLRARAAGHTVEHLPLVAAAGLERGLTAAAARAKGEFTEWSGSVGRWPELADDLQHPRSPTGLQQWAKCPFSYFLGRVLGLRDLEDPGDAETITPMDRGTLVHADPRAVLPAAARAGGRRAMDARRPRRAPVGGRRHRGDLPSARPHRPAAVVGSGVGGAAPSPAQDPRRRRKRPAPRGGGARRGRARVRVRGRADAARADRSRRRPQVELRRPSRSHRPIGRRPQARGARLQDRQRRTTTPSSTPSTRSTTSWRAASCCSCRSTRSPRGRSSPTPRRPRPTTGSSASGARSR